MPKFIEVLSLEVLDKNVQDFEAVEHLVLNTASISHVSTVIAKRADLDPGSIPYEGYEHDKAHDHGPDFYDCGFITLTTGEKIATQETYATLKRMLMEDSK